MWKTNPITLLLTFVLRFEPVAATLLVRHALPCRLMS